jgi:hypothetical protein
MPDPFVAHGIAIAIDEELRVVTSGLNDSLIIVQIDRNLALELAAALDHLTANFLLHPAISG